MLGGPMERIVRELVTHPDIDQYGSRDLHFSHGRNELRFSGLISLRRDHEHGTEFGHYDTPAERKVAWHDIKRILEEIVGDEATLDFYEPENDKRDHSFNFKIEQKFPTYELAKKEIDALIDYGVLRNSKYIVTRPEEFEEEE